MEKSLVSIIVTAYNGSFFLKNFSLPSILAQTYKTWELIIVDDASTDDTQKIAKEFCRARENVRYIRHEKNKGVSGGWNTGVASARGEIIAFLDQDDVWLPGKLERQVKVLRDANSKEGTVSCTSLCWILDIGSMKIMSVNVAPPSGQLIYRSALKRIGPFDEGPIMRDIQDFDLAAKLGFFYGDNPNYHLVLNEPLIIFVRHPNSSSSRDNGGLEKFISRFIAAAGKYDTPEFSRDPEVKIQLGFWYLHLVFNLLMAGDRKRAKKYLKKAVFYRKGVFSFSFRIFLYLPRWCFFLVYRTSQAVVSFLRKISIFTKWKRRYKKEYAETTRFIELHRLAKIKI